MSTISNFRFVSPYRVHFSDDPETNTNAIVYHFILQLEIGSMYEIVVTNLFCLYRYRSGDIIKIVSFYNQAPQYEFCFR